MSETTTPRPPAGGRPMNVIINLSVMAIALGVGALVLLTLLGTNPIGILGPAPAPTAAPQPTAQVAPAPAPQPVTIIV